MWFCSRLLGLQEVLVNLFFLWQKNAHHEASWHIQRNSFLHVSHPVKNRVRKKFFWIACRYFNFICARAPHDTYTKKNFIWGTLQKWSLDCVFHSKHLREFECRCPTIHVVRIDCNTCQLELLWEIDDWGDTLWCLLWVWGGGKCHLRCCRDPREIYLGSRKSRLFPSTQTER